jgi:O-antigen ligase
MYYGMVYKAKKNAITYITLVLASLFLFGMILMLSSKLIIVLTVTIIIIFLLVVGYTREHLLASLLITAGIIGAGLFAVKNFSYLNYRINVTEIKMYSGKEDDQNGVAIRLFMWKTAIDHIAQRPLLGYGIRGAKRTTLDKYARSGFDLGVRGNYHSHNQYLESALMGGIPGAMIFLIFVISALRKSIASRNFLLFLMLCHFAVQSVFESTFEVQHEQVFYIFFIFLFYYHAPQFQKAHHT